MRIRQVTTGPKPKKLHGEHYYNPQILTDRPQQTSKTILIRYENGAERGEGGLKFLKYPDTMKDKMQNILILGFFDHF